MENQQPTQQPQAVINQQPTQQPKPPKKKSGAGKKILGALAIILLVVAAGVGGYTYAKNQTQKDADAKVAELQAQIDAAEAKQEPVAEDTTSQVLTVKEWGVVFPVDTGYTNIAYAIEKTEEGEMARIVAADLIKTSECTGNKGELGTITRSSTAPKAIDGSARQDAVKVGDYYYVWTSIQQSCNSKTELEQQYVAQMKSAVESAKPVAKTE